MPSAPPLIDRVPLGAALTDRGAILDRFLAWVEDSHGQLKPAQQWPASPIDFQVATGSEPQIALCLVLMAVGFLAVWVIDTRWGVAARTPES